VILDFSINVEQYIPTDSLSSKSHQVQIFYNIMDGILQIL